MQTTSSVTVLYKLDQWLDTMRGADGYGGPVAHWWQNSLQFTGAGLDWRYEGIILGYLALWRKTRTQVWRDKAQRAADDLVRGQLPEGNFRNSAFELNPYTGGTPHESAADIGLLHLAKALRSTGDPAWETYCRAAKLNLEGYYLARLWDANAGHFRDNLTIPSFVPNKCATLCEALFALSELTGDANYIEQYMIPTLDKLLTLQVQEQPLRGAIYQNALRGTLVAKFFPYYAARCVPALVLGYHYTGRQQYADAAVEAMRFVFRWCFADGSFAQVVYPSGVNRYQQWIAGVGDILRAARMVEPFGLTLDLNASETWMLNGRQPCGGIGTAHGFEEQSTQRKPRALPEFRDVLPVCGWCDKAFRYLAETLSDDDGTVSALAANDPVSPTEVDCLLRGQHVRYREDATSMTLQRGKDLLYHWRKGASWADVCSREVMWK